MKVEPIDPNKEGNVGLVNRYKIRLRQLSGALHFILKNHISRTSYNSFHPDKEKFLYKDDRSGRQITCGLILFTMALQVIKPQLVIDHRAKERKMEDLTIASCQDNVRTYLTRMQEMRIEIDFLPSEYDCIMCFILVVTNL